MAWCLQRDFYPYYTKPGRESKCNCTRVLKKAARQTSEVFKGAE